jgi:hypothetical protein
MNTELYADLESKLRYDWEPSRPLEFVSTPDFRMHRSVREPYNRLWNEIRDGPKLAKELEAWEKKQENYVIAKKKLWPATIYTLTTEVRTEVMVHAKYADLAREGDAPDIWDLRCGIQKHK